MARTRSSPKSDLVREYLATHPTATMSQIVTDLKAQGISESLVKLVKSAGKQKKPATAKKKRGRKAAAPAAKAAASTNAAGGTKAEAIRDVAKGMEKPFRPRDVRDVLATQGIDASTTQIGQVLRSMGMKRKRRRKAAVGAAAPAVASNGLSINDLVAAKKVVEQVGSVEKVREALAALARLS